MSLGCGGLGSLGFGGLRSLGFRGFSGFRVYLGHRSAQEYCFLWGPMHGGKF